MDNLIIETLLGSHNLRTEYNRKGYNVGTDVLFTCTTELVRKCTHCHNYRVPIVVHNN